VSVGAARWDVVAESPLAGVTRSVDAILRVSAFGAPLLLLLVAGVTWAGTGRTLRPIERIRSEVEELSSSTLSRRVPVPATDDEVAALAEMRPPRVTRGFSELRGRDLNPRPPGYELVVSRVRARQWAVNMAADQHLGRFRCRVSLVEANCPRAL
jgi:HAMP domain-containing protein